MKAYLDIVHKVLNDSRKFKPNRTGIPVKSITGAMFEHDMSSGFPIVTTKHVPFKLVSSELEFFIKGITNKKWLQDRNNHIWDEWCSPEKVPYGTSDDTKARMVLETDLGPVYGAQWRNFNGVDQLKLLIDTLKKDPYNRRMIVSAWNPVDIPKMALPPCHYGFQVIVNSNDELDLIWNQRSVDVALGLPFNISSYGLLLHLLSLESGFKPGKLIGMLGDVHIYEPHIDGLSTQLGNKPHPLPEIQTKEFASIFDWEYTQTSLLNYNHHEKINFTIAV